MRTLRKAASRAPVRPANNFHERRRATYRNYREVMVGGIRTACLSREQMAKLMVGDCLAARSDDACAQACLRRQRPRDRRWRDIARRSAPFDAGDIIHADGQPVVFASKLLTTSPIPERSATTDFIHDAARGRA